jgi:hypothetical protein
MGRLALGIVLSLLPRQWRERVPLFESIPWQRATIVSGILESLLALLALVSWYSISVTTWAANLLDSALRGCPEASVPGQAIGFSALVLWLLHPQTWFIGYFAIEGAVRMLAAISTEQTFGTLPLAFVDWCYGKATHRPLEGDALHAPSGKAQVQSFVSAMKQEVLLRRLPEVADELVARDEGEESLLEIHSSRPKAEWVPPKIVRVGDAYFRLEHVERRRPPRPFVYRLRRLPAGVPGRTVIAYDAPPRTPR